MNCNCTSDQVPYSTAGRVACRIENCDSEIISHDLSRAPPNRRRRLMDTCSTRESVLPRWPMTTCYPFVSQFVSHDLAKQSQYPPYYFSHSTATRTFRAHIPIPTFTRKSPAPDTARAALSRSPYEGCSDSILIHQFLHVFDLNYVTCRTTPSSQ